MRCETMGQAISNLRTVSKPWIGKPVDIYTPQLLLTPRLRTMYGSEDVRDVRAAPTPTIDRVDEIFFLSFRAQAGAKRNARRGHFVGGTTPN